MKRKPYSAEQIVAVVRQHESGNLRGGYCP